MQEVQINSINQELLLYFLGHLRNTSNKALSTISNIERDVKRFLEYLEINQEEISGNSIKEYISILEDEYPEASYISKLSSIRQFTNWLNLENNPFWKLKFKNSENKDYYKTEELESLWGSGFDYEKMLIQLMYEFYLSIQELCELNLANYNKANNKLLARGIWLKSSPVLAQNFKSYLNEYRPLNTKTSANLQDPLFISENGERLKSFDLLKILRKHQIKNTKLKRSRIIHLVESGLSIDLINSEFGLRLTDNYGSPEQEYRLLPAYAKFHPRN